uniref:Uncharacterized protein n=1 Tax=Nelumbo nucifera TaxID=4432 RepID=A0A822YEJ4_NELNU|nr:TPA_asm: hypothetical protein HUJ06_029396 [Nelumbo nucifera]
MSEVTASKSWSEELASLVEDTGIRYTDDGIGTAPTAGEKKRTDFTSSEGLGGDAAEVESFKDQVKGFLKAVAEMLHELARGCRDIVQQTLGNEASFIAERVAGPWAKVSNRLRFMNELLPEDRDPAHAWPVVFFVFILALAGAAMFAPMVNPYDSKMSKEERKRTWEKWTPRRKMMYFLAQRFPRFLAYFYKRIFLSGKHGELDKWLSVSLGKKDRILIEDPKFEAFWQRNVEESIRQGNPKPFVEEAILQVSNWGFNLADLKVQKKRLGKGILPWLKSMYSQADWELTGFLGPIHIWQGMDDQVVPPAVTDFVHRILPEAIVHKLVDEGHFSYFCFCDECHRQIFLTLFGTPQGPLNRTIEPNQIIFGEMDGPVEVPITDSTTY